MDNYLYFRLGPYRVLVDAGSVLEIVDAGVDEHATVGKGSPQGGRALWRGEAVASMDMMTTMEPDRRTQGTMAIVVGCSDGRQIMPLLLKVDDVRDVLVIPADAFTPLPVRSDTLGLYFDALYFRDEERAALLRLRASALLESARDRCAGDVS